MHKRPWEEVQREEVGAKMTIIGESRIALQDIKESQPYITVREGNGKSTVERGARREGNGGERSEIDVELPGARGRGGGRGDWIM